MPPRKTLPQSTLYNIAWIAALHIERAAATASLDERHEEPEGFIRHDNDDNAYDWGEIGKHNVVIASLPAGVYGTTSAAVTASHLLSSLPHIKIGLLVGIGGGIPHPRRDIRLGDVVVSQPDGKSGGVVQYDLGKAKAHQDWERKGSLNMPPTVLLSALGSLQAEHEIQGSRMDRILKTMITKFPLMKKQFSYQGAENDRLFLAEYDHPQSNTCDLCDSSQEVKREERESTSPNIHYGIIASGNTLVKDARARDNISDLAGEDCLCVEMEAAGLANSFPCLVIRGICDYSDSHKNDRWQRYASASAAAFAVELLGYLPVRQLQDTPRALEIMKSIDCKVSEMSQNIKESRARTMIDWLPIARGAAFDSADHWLEATCLENTRVDVLHQIEEWAVDLGSTTLFWLNGMAGTGKSTIARTVAHRLAMSGRLGGSFFFKRGEADRDNPTKLFTTLAAGLHRWQPTIARNIEEEIHKSPQIFHQFCGQQLQKLILDPISKAELATDQAIIMVIDALDECDNNVIANIITDILPMASSLRPVRLKFFLTSRPQLPIKIGFSTIKPRSVYQDFILQDVSSDIIRLDIEAFLRVNIAAIRDRYNTQEEKLPQDWPSKLDFDLLVSMAVPLFIVASTICRFLDNGRFGNPKRLLNQLLNMESRGYQSTLDRMYMAVLNQQFDENDTPDQRDRIVEEFRHIIGPIILLSTPLTIPSLANLLSQGKYPEFEQVIEDRLKVLHSVLSIPPLSERALSPVRLLHLSFRDFLLDPFYQNQNPFWISKTVTHALLANKCLSLMEKCLHEDICGLKHPDIDASHIAQAKIDAYIAPELQYACYYWAHHLIQGVKDRRIIRITVTFLEEYLLFWLEAMSLLGQSHGCIAIIESLQDATATFGSQQLSLLLEDTTRFILSNSKTISSSPLQIYSSAILFAPMKSKVRNAFSTRVPEWITLQPTVEEYWSDCLQTLDSPCGLLAIVFSPNSKLLATQDEDLEVRIWEVSTGKCLQHLDVINLKDPSRGSEELEIEYCIYFSADSTLLYTLLASRILVWRVDTGQCFQYLDHYSSRISSIAVLSSHRIASGSDDGIIRIWEAEAGLLLSKLQAHGESVSKLAFSSPLQLLASGSTDGTGKLWHIGSSATSNALQLPRGRSILQIVFADQSGLVAFARRQEVSLWDVTTDQMVQRFDLTGSFQWMDFPSSTMLTIMAGGKLQVWKSGKIEYPTWLNLRDSRSELLSCSGIVAVLEKGKGEINLWRIETGEHIRRIQSPYLQWRPKFTLMSNGKLLAIGNGEGLVQIWKAGPGQQPELQYCRVMCCISPDARLAASASSVSKGFTITIWNPETGQRCYQVETASMGRETQRSVHLDFSLDSRLLLAVNASCLHLWDVNLGTKLYTLGFPRGFDGYYGTFSTTSKLVATICVSQEHRQTLIQIWDVPTSRCLSSFNGPKIRDLSWFKNLQ
ncbi:G-protein beta WD-40 repeat-containing protein [Fusarium sp. NRRL 52700]|nr:G-protein beta WD-40 repeat-containing protein [Fusarium sp. NRRL 52700]